MPASSGLAAESPCWSLHAAKEAAALGDSRNADNPGGTSQRSSTLCRSEFAARPLRKSERVHRGSCRCRPQEAIRDRGRSDRRWTERTSRRMDESRVGRDETTSDRTSSSRLMDDRADLAATEGGTGCRGNRRLPLGWIIKHVFSPFAQVGLSVPAMTQNRKRSEHYCDRTHHLQPTNVFLPVSAEILCAMIVRLGR